MEHRIENEETGLTGGHPAVIITGTITAGTVCRVNGILALDETTGEFTAHDLQDKSGAYIALEPISAETTGAKVLLHGTFNGDLAVKADGSALTIAEKTFIQKHSAIFFV